MHKLIIRIIFDQNFSNSHISASEQYFWVFFSQQASKLSEVFGDGFHEDILLYNKELLFEFMYSIIHTFGVLKSIKLIYYKIKLNL